MGKKIKIIDLLCYISIGDYDKLPKEFEYAGYCWRWCIACKIYETRDEDKNEMNLYKYFATEGDLNDEVEILDEEDEFEDIEEIPFDNGMKTYDISTYHQIERMTYAINDLINNQKKIIMRLKDE